MSEVKTLTMDECMDQIKTYIKRPENLELIEKAYAFAHEAHKGQMRKSGEPYEVHVIQVAAILASLHCSAKTIAAGLLHDTVEDCEDVTYERIQKEFSTEIADLVEAVTKVGKLNREFKDEKEYLASNHRKLFIAMAKDIRVILIKLSDRLHNMRTLQFQSEEKQRKIAKETIQVYAPIAHRLGISKMKNELEDLCFKYLLPEKYCEIKDLVAQRETERNELVVSTISELEKMLHLYNIPYRIFGRSKHFYSIYKKMMTKNKRFEEILDLQAIRIVTDTVNHCYEILGYIHATYRPIPGRFKDYIAMPKSNMYQSLHTTVVIPGSGDIFEIQIRTEDMDMVAERGVAAHWLYKENKVKKEEYSVKEIEDKLSWFRDFSMITDEESSDPLEYMSVLQQDIFEANVYCLTPRGKVIALPSGSTPVDFAYRIHTEIGNKTVGAVVNGAIVPLNTELKTGDVVSIMTNKNSAGPSADWIKIVKSAHARNKIRSFLMKQHAADKKEMIKKGEQMLEAEFHRLNLDDHHPSSKQIESILKSLSFRTVDDMLAAIGTGKLSVSTVMEKLGTNKPALDNNEEIIKIYNKQERKLRPSACGVIVPGIDTIQVSLSPCCHPIPGDEIIGYVSKGKGVKVHRVECPNIQNEQKRLIPVTWSEQLENKLYVVKLVLRSEDRSYLLSDIVTVLQQNAVELRHVESGVDTESLITTTRLEVGVKSKEKLDVLMANLKKIRSVNEVTRVIL